MKTRSNDEMPRNDKPEGPGAPRWLKRSALIAVGIAIVLAIMQLVIGGQHGPSRHPESNATMPAHASVLTLEMLEHESITQFPPRR